MKVEACHWVRRL